MNVASVLKEKGRAVTTVGPKSNLAEIAAKLAEHKIGAVIVVENETHVVGIVSERDVVKAIAAQGETILKTLASELMTRDVITCEESSTLEDLMDMMTKGRFRHVPVVENGELVGIISIGDVVKNHIAEVELEVAAMRGYLATG